MVRFDLGPLFQGEMRVVKLQNAYNLLFIENAFYLENYVGCPFLVDTCSIWPQMRPWSSLNDELFNYNLNVDFDKMSHNNIT